MMTHDTPHPAATFAATFVLYYIAHLIADHWCQRSEDAVGKQAPGWAGVRHCLSHTASVVLTTAVVLGVGMVLLGLRAPVDVVAASLLVVGVSHYLVDRGTPLRWLARLTANEGYMDRVSVVRAPDQVPDTTGPGTGAFHLDQSWHVAWAGVGALIIALGAA
ncbi:DUF3307 domain-containing protein [Nocardiopsis sp. NPDC006938]|uniref:DUF3307 domain-containing protein n=1 Tax=Nocardiopsis sp. NPDC006938 TaxID=3364337 RepID=UPI00368AEABE